MRVYFDTMIWIYFVEGNPVFGPAARTLVRRLRLGGHVMLSSFLVEGELLVLPKRTRDLFREATYRHLLSQPGVISTPYLAPSASLYADIRAKFRTSPTDTLHATLAAVGNADLLVTEDKKLQSAIVPGIGKIVGIAQAISLL